MELKFFKNNMSVARGGGVTSLMASGPGVMYTAIVCVRACCEQLMYVTCCV